MRIASCLSLLFLTALSALAGDVRIINASCENALNQAEVLAAQRKWWPDRPDPKAPVLSIRTHANFAKNYLVPLGLGIGWSHEKVGELAFEEQGQQSCKVTSNGHPADIVLTELAKAEFPASPRSTEGKEASKSAGKSERTQAASGKCPEGTHWGDSPNGDPVCVWTH
jgi:hypothetical protein